jgi:nitrite reductase/ring-hydroxylating ferredoxin subunit
MSKRALIDMTRRTLAHARARTVPLAAEVGRVKAANYHDPERWEAELARIFKRVPMVLGFSCELAEPHSYKSVEASGVPVLMTRATDGSVNAFVNMCSHRGAIVADDGLGHSRRFSCPYHGWVYDGGGQLVAIADREEFGDLDPSCNGLTPLPVGERAGLIFVGLTPNTDLDLDTYLCGYGSLLEQLGLAECHQVGSQTVAGPNWKLAYDGYLDFYHLPVLHRNTFGADVPNKAIYDAWGPHQRVSSPDPRMVFLDDLAEEEWPQDLMTNGIWTIFPHVSIASFPVKAEGIAGGGRMYMVSQLFPGVDPDSSVTVQNFLTRFEPTDEIRSAIDSQMDFLLGVVRDEDYWTGNRIQRSAKTGAKSEFLFGRNEAGGQRFHQWVDSLVAADDHADYLRLFETATESHQP